MSKLSVKSLTSFNTEIRNKSSQVYTHGLTVLCRELVLDPPIYLFFKDMIFNHAISHKKYADNENNNRQTSNSSKSIIFFTGFPKQFYEFMMKQGQKVVHKNVS